MKRIITLITLLLVLSGCRQSLPPDQAALFFSKHLDLRNSWELHSTSVHELRREMYQRYSNVLGVVDNIRKKHEVDSNLAAYLDWLEKSTKSIWEEVREELDELDEIIGDNGHLYWYDSEYEHGHVILKHGEIVKRIPAITIYKDEE